jgi:molybdopterin molybdotransferase
LLFFALNIAEVTVFRPLAVGVSVDWCTVIIAAAGQPAEPHQIYDANRPMLLGLVQGWGYHRWTLACAR